jgi:hypothetical protein
LAKAENKGVEGSKFLQPPQPVPDPEIARIKKAFDEREAAEVQKFHELHAHQQRMLEFNLDREKADSLRLRQAEDLRALNDLKEAIRAENSGVKGLVRAIENRWSPGLGAERAKERRRRIAQLKRRQERERKDWEVLQEQTRQQEIDNLKERQAKQFRDRARVLEEEHERRVREHEKAKRLLAEMQAEEKKLEKDRDLREGPEPPTLGKR